MTGFTLGESRLAGTAGQHDINTDHDALLALEAVIPGDDDGPLPAGPRQAAAGLPAGANGELDGYRSPALRALPCRRAFWLPHRLARALCRRGRPHPAR